MTVVPRFGNTNNVLSISEADQHCTANDEHNIVILFLSSYSPIINSFLISLTNTFNRYYKSKVNKHGEKSALSKIKDRKRTVYIIWKLETNRNGERDIYAPGIACACEMPSADPHELYVD